jgi:hypothetical protein
VSLDCDQELCQVAVADGPSQLLLGDEDSGGGPALGRIALSIEQLRLHERERTAARASCIG